MASDELMADETNQRTMDEIVFRMIELAENDFNCSQILITLTLEREGRKNPGLIRSISGLGNGCGFFNETCGILTGAACMISWYAGKGSENEKESDKLLPMLQDLNDWFIKEIDGKYQSTRCKDIVGDLIGSAEGKQICGGLLLNTYDKATELLESYGFISD